MEKLSIFGGTGFIGKRYLERYPDNVLIKRNSNFPETKDSLYLISTTNNYNVFSDLHLDIDTNLMKFMSVLKNSKGTMNFISSWFVYGEGHGNQFNAAHEDSAKNPTGFYSITKSCAEDLLISYSKTFNKNYRIIRLCNVIGGDPGFGKKKNALEFLVDKIVKNEDVEIYDGDNYRNYLHVDDVCDAIKLIVENGDLNEVYNVGSNVSHRLIDLMYYVKEVSESESKIKLVRTPKFHEIVQTKDFFMNTNKLKGLGFFEKYTIYEVLNRLIIKNLRNNAEEKLTEYVEFRESK